MDPTTESKDEKPSSESSGNSVQGEQQSDEISTEEKAIEPEVEEKAEAIINEENLQKIRLEALSELTDEGRVLLYEKAVQKGNSKHALQCFLACLQGLKEGAKFPVLPQCLHHIAEIYSAEDDYESAIPFAQAEKLYYETALITAGTSDLLDKLKESSVTSDITAESDGKQDDESETLQVPPPSTPESTASLDPQAQRAVEFENLAHLCLQHKNTQLALEYCAKAVKIRQAHLGENHPVTRRTLDLFTIIYAEMGKEQYSAALDKFSAIKKKESEEKEEMSSKAEANQGEISDMKKATEEVICADDVQSSELTQESLQDTPAPQDSIEITLTPSLALLLYFLITVLVVVLVTTFLCYYTDLDTQTLYSYVMTRMRFYYYYYFRAAPKGDHYF